MKKGSLILAGTILTLAVVLGTACTKKSDLAVTSSSDQTTQAEIFESAAEEEQTTEAVSRREAYHMLQGTVVKAAGDEGVFTLLADDGKEYHINLSEIGDVEVDLEENVQVAIAYIGEPLGDLKDVTLVLALPEQEEWSVFVEKGVTTSNSMSSFAIETEDGQKLRFLKDNCPIQEGAMEGDSGDKVRVAYVNSQGTNFPIEVRKSE